MKKILLPLLLCTILVLNACAGAEQIQTQIGNYTVTRDFKEKITASSGEVTPAEGNILLVVTLTPEEGAVLDLDQADEYFMNGTKVTLDSQTYDIKCVVYERENAGDKVIKCCLVFEVTDNEYADAAEMPEIQITLPSGLPEHTPSPADATEATDTAEATDTVTDTAEATDTATATPAA